MIDRFLPRFRSHLPACLRKRFVQPRRIEVQLEFPGLMKK